MSTKEEIFEYVTHSPENTNPAVVRSMLNELPEPEGVKTITNNGTHDVKDYASAEVAVPETPSPFHGQKIKLVHGSNAGFLIVRYIDDTAFREKSLQSGYIELPVSYNFDIDLGGYTFGTVFHVYSNNNTEITATITDSGGMDNILLIRGVADTNVKNTWYTFKVVLGSSSSWVTPTITISPLE